MRIHLLPSESVPFGTCFSSISNHVLYSRRLPARQRGRGLLIGIWIPYCVGGYQADSKTHQPVAISVHLHGVGRAHFQPSHHDSRLVVHESLPFSKVSALKAAYLGEGRAQADEQKCSHIRLCPYVLIFPSLISFPARQSNS